MTDGFLGEVLEWEEAERVQPDECHCHLARPAIDALKALALSERQAREAAERALNRLENRAANAARLSTSECDEMQDRALRAEYEADEARHALSQAEAARKAAQAVTQEYVLAVVKMEAACLNRERGGNCEQHTILGFCNIDQSVCRYFYHCHFATPENPHGKWTLCGGG